MMKKRVRICRVHLLLTVQLYNLTVSLKRI